MPPKPAMTTIKVSRRVIRHIQSNAGFGEAVDDTLRRILKLKGGSEKANAVQPMTTTVKISRIVMSHIQKESRESESRDATLGRLLGVSHDDGNIQEPKNGI